MTVFGVDGLAPETRERYFLYFSGGLKMAELSKEVVEKVFEIVEQARLSGKIRRGVNEATKAIEKGEAKLVVVAGDVDPKEITMHLPLLAKEKGIPFAEVPKREELGAAAGIEVPTTAVAVIEVGEAKDSLKAVVGELK